MQIVVMANGQPKGLSELDALKIDLQQGEACTSARLLVKVLRRKDAIRVSPLASLIEACQIDGRYGHHTLADVNNSDS